MNFSALILSFKEVIQKVITAFLGWGLGVGIMLLYCFFIIWLNNNFNKEIMIMGSLAFLIISFFFVDMWWHYKRIKKMEKYKNAA